uniref:Uncharacterized protein n=1 Tax=viral metagenome TaxID=1070528 RepID=A0A6C0KRG1_9ZZZZ
MNNTLDNFSFFFRPVPDIIHSVNNLPATTLNMPMFMDIKNDPQLLDYKFDLDNNPRLIPAVVMFYYEEKVPHDLRPENIDLEQSINGNARTFVINLVKDLIKTEINIRSNMTNQINDPDLDEEIIHGSEPGVEMQIKPSIQIAEPVPELFERSQTHNPYDLDSIPVEATIIPGASEKDFTDLPQAMQLAGKTKKRINKYKKGKKVKSKTIKTHNKKSKKSIKSKKYKKNRKTIHMKSK